MQIFGKKYKIIKVAKNELDNDKIGLINYRKGIIYIVKDLAPEVWQETLLHETIHAIDEEMVLSLNEDLIRRLSCSIFAILKENGINIEFHN